MRKEIRVQCPHCKSSIDVDENLEDGNEIGIVRCECGAKLEVGFYRVGWVNLISEPDGDKP